MTADIENDGQYWLYTISGVDVELKEKQFMNDEVEYYKEVKTKSKKNAHHAEDKNLRFSR